VMETSKTVLGPEHPSTLTSMGNLASTFWNQGRWAEAEKLEVQMMETRKTVLGLEHPDTLTSMFNLSHTWKQQGRDDNALAMLEICVPLLNQQLGSNHPHAISATATLKNWRTPVHGPSHIFSESSSGRHEIYQSDSERPTQARPSQVPGTEQRSNQPITKGLQPLDRTQKPRKRDVIKKLFRPK
jgi:Tetratricopeptide repeat